MPFTREAQNSESKQNQVVRHHLSSGSQLIDAKALEISWWHCGPGNQLINQNKKEEDGPDKSEEKCGLRLHAGGVFALFITSVNASSGIVFLFHISHWTG